MGKSGKAGVALKSIPQDVRSIPNIDLMNIFEWPFAKAGVQYETLSKLAEVMGRNPVPHRHDDCLQIHFIEAGHFDLILDNVPYNLSGPAVFLTPPSIPHAFSLSPDAVGHVLTVRQELYWQLARTDHFLPAREALHPFCVSFRDVEDESAAEDINACFTLLCREIRRGKFEGETAIRSLAATILAKVVRTRRDAGIAPALNLNRLALYRRFLELVDDRFAAHWALARYADSLNITQSRLYELCQDSAGRSPKSIVSDRLVQEGRRYLAFSNAGIKEIAAALGFEDENYFYRFFKRLTGETPSRYRERIRSAREPEKVQ